MLIVNIIGKKGSGKSTAAKYLVAQYGFHRISFAKHLKEVAKLLFGFSEEQVNGSLKEVIDERWGVCPREVLQWLGTDCLQYSAMQHFPEFAKKIGRLFWVKKVLEEISELRKEGVERIVADDCRFNHENFGLMDYANENSDRFIGVKIIRESNKPITSLEQHASETETDTITYNFSIDNNNISLEELYRGISSAIG